MQHHQHTTVRRVLSDEIDRLIYLLDMIDGDTDLEPQCEDEGAQCEGEGDQCDDESAPDTDREYSLGSLSHIHQGAWAGGAGGDLEAGVEELNAMRLLEMEAEASRTAAVRLGDVIYSAD